MKKLLYILISTSLFVGGSTPLVVLAQSTVTPCPQTTAANGGCNLGYTALEPIPGLNTGTDLTSSNSLPVIINAIFKILITIGALLAVLMLTVGGIQYMVSSSAEVKTTGINKAQAALWGIVLIAASWLILNTINPNLLNFSLNPCPSGSAGCTVIGTATSNSTTGSVAAFQNQLNTAVTQKNTPEQCAAAKQQLVDSGAQLGMSSQAQEINGYILRGRGADGTMLTSDQKAALRTQLTALNQQTAILSATAGSCDGN